MKKIILSGNPLSTQHIYKFTCKRGYPHFYMTKEGKERKEQYRSEAFYQYRGKVISAKCRMELTVFFKDKRDHDVDNYNKLVLDSFEGIVYENDKQVKKLTTNIIESPVDKPRIEVEINLLK